jgi:hypothetical protein
MHHSHRALESDGGDRGKERAPVLSGARAQRGFQVASVIYR